MSAIGYTEEEIGEMMSAYASRISGVTLEDPVKVRLIGGSYRRGVYAFVREREWTGTWALDVAAFDEHGTVVFLNRDEEPLSEYDTVEEALDRFVAFCDEMKGAFDL